MQGNMGSKLIFIFFLQTVLLFNPFTVKIRPVDENRGGFCENNTHNSNFPLDLNLPLLRNNSDEEEENETQPRRPGTKDASSMNEDRNFVDPEKTNLELRLCCGDQSSSSSSSSTVTHSNHTNPQSFPMTNLNNNGESSSNLYGDNRVTIGGGGGDDGDELPNLVSSNETEEIDDYLAVMGCKLCFCYCMVSKRRPECPMCNNRRLMDVCDVNR